MKKTILALGISAVLAAIACSSEKTGSGDSNFTSGDTKKVDTKPAPSAPSKPAPGPAPTATTSPTGTCMTQCLANNAKAKKLNDEDTACISKCPADPGGPATETDGGVGDGDPPPVDSAAEACWRGCDKTFDDACKVDAPTCEAIFACEDKCSSTTDSSSKDDDGAK